MPHCTTLPGLMSIREAFILSLVALPQVNNGADGLLENEFAPTLMLQVLLVSLR